MHETESSLEITKKIGIIKVALEAIRTERADDRLHLDDEELMEARIAESLLFDGLPSDVVEIHLGNGTFVQRYESELKIVPEDRRKTWNLEQVDEYAAQLSQLVMQPWAQIFPSSSK